VTKLKVEKPQRLDHEKGGLYENWYRWIGNQSLDLQSPKENKKY